MTKRIASLVLLLTFALSAFAQTTEKTFTQAFNAEGQSRVKFDLPGPVDLKIWNNPHIRFEIIVNLPSGSTSMLEQLAKVGRYSLKAEVLNGSLVVTAPNMQKVVRVKGEELRENVSYVIFVPKDMEVFLNEPPVVADVQK